MKFAPARHISNSIVGSKALQPNGKGDKVNIKRLFATAFGHFSIDVLNSSVAIILTVFSGKFDLTVSQIGMAAMIYTFAASLTQPFFGIWADRLRGRWLGALSVAWTALFYTSAAFAPNYATLVICLTIGAFGSGAFHPVGMINATAAGGHTYASTATSFFFLLGQIGLAVGPIVSGIVLQRWGMAGLPYIALGVLPSVVIMFVYLSTPIAEAARPRSTALNTDNSAVNTQHNFTWSLLVAFILLIGLRATTSQGFTTLLPKHWDDLGFSPANYGVMVGVFSFAAALGTFIGGYLGDRGDRRLILFTSTLLSVPFTYLLLHTGGWVFFVMAALSGALINIPHSILVVMAQQMLPARKGMIGGTVLGFTFASGALMTWIASSFADHIGLATVLNLLAFFPIGAALGALLLPTDRARASFGNPPNVAPSAAD